MPPLEPCATEWLAARTRLFDEIARHAKQGDLHIAQSITGTRKYAGGGECARTPITRTDGKMLIEVLCCDTWDAVAKLGPATTVAVLNMASATWVAGQWRKADSETQSDEMCRQSTLGVVLETNARMYPLATDALLVSPGVLRLRTGAPDYALLPDALRVRADVITCAALDRSGRTADAPRCTLDTATAIMRTKIDALLARCNEFGYERLVLGAWGCDEFRNEPSAIAALFRDALREKYARCFTHVCFAIGGTDSPRNYSVFTRVLGSDAH